MFDMNFKCVAGPPPPKKQMLSPPGRKSGEEEKAGEASRVEKRQGSTDVARAAQSSESSKERKEGQQEEGGGGGGGEEAKEDASADTSSKASTSKKGNKPKGKGGRRPKSRIIGKGTYPSPNNFAERLMHVLENGIATDSIYWLGEGESIAVHMKNIKTSPVLDSHFQGNQYSSFIRNLNRW